MHELLRCSNPTFVLSVSASDIVQINYSLQVGDQPRLTPFQNRGFLLLSERKPACREPSRLDGARIRRLTGKPSSQAVNETAPIQDLGTGGNDIQADVLSSWKGDKGKLSRALRCYGRDEC